MVLGQGGGGTEGEQLALGWGWTAGGSGIRGSGCLSIRGTGVRAVIN